MIETLDKGRWSHLKRKANLPGQLWSELDQIGYLIQLPKKGILVNEGEVFNQEVFIAEGVMRAYTLDEQGTERTTAFYQVGDFMSTSTLRSQAGRSISIYQAIVDTVVITMDTDHFRRLLDQHPELMALAKLVKEQEIDRLKRRDDTLLQQTSVDKVLKFRDHYPNLEQHIPHYYIASYLGITPVSLSRVRKKLDVD